MMSSIAALIRSLVPSARLCRAALAIAALAVALAVVGADGGDTALAHDVGEGSDYVDVGLILEVPNDYLATTSHDLDIIIVNNGSRTAYDVEVVVDVVYPDKSRFKDVPEAPVGWASLDGASLRWTIPALGGVQREVLTAEVFFEIVGFHDNKQHPHELFGKVTTASFESDLHKENNTSRVWSYDYDPRQGDWIQVAVDYAVDVSVDRHDPSPGDTVNFTITASREQTHGKIGSPPFFPDVPPPIDLKVDIRLTDGLTHTGAPSFHTTVAGGTPKPAPGSATFHNGVFNIGTGQAGVPVVSHSVTLPVRVSSAAVVNEQCLTAKLTGNPPPGTGRLDDDISDNTATGCLGAPKVVFRDGTADLLTLFPCVGETAYPCNTADTIELAVTGGTSAVEARIPYEILQPENVVINIEDRIGRAVSGADIVWRTGNDVDHTPAGLDILPGVAAKLVAPVNDDGYSQHTFAIADATPSPASNPGSIRWFLAVNNFTLLDTSSQLSFGPQTLPSPRYDTVFEFSSLGTYIVNMTFGAQHSFTSYSDTETYTFHVGPIADLEVKAAPAAGGMTAGDQVAFTVTATNHGPEIRAPGVRVPVTLPAGMRFVRADSEDYDPQSGVWDIGELKRKDYRRVGLRQSEGATLTIVAELNGDVTGPVIGSIKSQDYCVRIKSGGTPQDDLECDGSPVPDGYTEQSAPYYDLRPDNNRFSLSEDWRVLADENVGPYVIGAGVVSTPGAGDAYVLGETITLEVTFSEPVRVQGTPTLALEIGEVTRQVPMSAHSGATLTFSYIIVAGDTDTDGVSVPRDGLTLPEGASITNLSGRTAAVLQFLGFGNQAGHKVSTQAAPEPEPPFYVDPPPATAALTATPGNGQVLLQRAPYCCDQKDIFYQLWRGDFPTWQDIAGSDQYTTEHTVTGLTNDDTYRFQVRAVYRHRADDGTVSEHPGAPSHTVVATPYAPPTTPPATPNRPPVFQPDTGSFSVVERAPRGTEVARVQATDPDPGDRLTYTLTGENHSKFNISKVNGEGVITVAEAELSYTWEPGGVSFNIGVEVTDNRGGRDNRVVGVEVTASEKRNNAPVAEEPGTLYVSCNANDLKQGIAVGTIMANDPEGDPLWYILVDGADKFQFKNGSKKNHPDPIWHDDHAVLVSDGSGAELQWANDQSVPDICGELITVIVEIEEEGNPGNNDTLQFEVQVGSPPQSQSQPLQVQEGPLPASPRRPLPGWRWSRPALTGRAKPYWWRSSSRGRPPA